MKRHYDRKREEQKFEIGDKVLILLAMNNHPLKAKFQGQYKIRRKVSDLNCIMDTLDHKKKMQKCHVNMIKLSIRRINDRLIFAIPESSEDGHPRKKSESYVDQDTSHKLKKSEVLTDHNSKLVHLPITKKDDLTALILEYELLIF